MFVSSKCSSRFSLWLFLTLSLSSLRQLSGKGFMGTFAIGKKPTVSKVCMSHHREGCRIMHDNESNRILGIVARQVLFYHIDWNIEMTEAWDSGRRSSSDHHPALWAQRGLLQCDQEVPEAALPLLQFREKVSMRPSAASAHSTCKTQNSLGSTFNRSKPTQKNMCDFIHF